MDYGAIFWDGKIAFEYSYKRLMFCLEPPLSFPDRRTDKDTAGFFRLLTASSSTSGEPICALARISLEICYASLFQDTLL